MRTTTETGATGETWHREQSDGGNAAYYFENTIAANYTLVSPRISLLDFAEFAVNFNDDDADYTVYTDLSLKRDPDVGDDTHWVRNIPSAILNSLLDGSLRTFGGASPWLRVRFVNGSTEAATAQIYIRLNRYASGGITASMNQVLSNADQVQRVRICNDYRDDLIRGLFSDQSFDRKFCRNPDVGTGGYELVWANSGAYTIQSSAEAIQIRVGGNADDTAGGAGAQQVNVEWIDATTGAIATVELTPAGASASAPSSTTGWFPFRAYVPDDKCGTQGGSNVGAIVIEGATSSNTYATIEAGKGQTQIGVFPVPDGKTGILTDLNIYVDGNKDADVRLWRIPNARDTSTPFSPKRIQFEYDGIVAGVNEVPEIKLEAGDLFYIEAQGGAASTTVSANFNVRLESQTGVTPQ